MAYATVSWLCGVEFGIMRDCAHGVMLCVQTASTTFTHSTRVGTTVVRVR
jgi:hypothetical protein